MQAPQKPWRREDNLAFVFCVVIGLFLAVAPHLAVLVRYGTLEFITDSNDLAYLTVSRVPYEGENSLRDPYTRPEWGTSSALGKDADSDPFLKPGARLPSLYAWLQYVPFAKLTRFLGLPLILLGLVWRAIGGPLLGGSLFFLFRRLFERTRAPTAWALGASLICLGDAGFLGDWPLILNWLYLRNAWLGKYWLLNYCRLNQFRVTSPLLTLPFLILLAAVLVPSAKSPIRVILAGSGLLGLCILTYFFTWTAAVAGLGLYFSGILGCAWLGIGDRRGHIARAWTLAAVLGGGLAIGAPQIIGNAFQARTFSSPQLKPILQRFRKGFPLAHGNPLRRAYLKNYSLWLELLAGAAGLILFQSAGLGFVWCVALAAYALTNSAIVTGLEFENDHWLTAVGLAFAEISLISAGVLVLDAWPRLNPAGRRMLWGLPVLTLLSGILWRSYQALAAPWAAEMSRTLEELRPLRKNLAVLPSDCTIAGASETAVALLFTRCAPLFQRYDQWTSLVSTDQLIERSALNGWLRGLDLAAYLKSSETEPMYVEKYLTKGVTSEEIMPEAIHRKRAEVFTRLLAGSAPELLRKYRPNALLLPEPATTPGRARPWELIQRTQRWSLWKKGAS